MTTTIFHLAELVMYRDNCVEMAIAAEADGEYQFAESIIDTANEISMCINRQESLRRVKGIPSIFA